MSNFISPYCQITEGCERPRLTNMEGCYTCEHEKRKAEKDAMKPVNKAKAIPKRSAKKIKEDSQYMREKPGFMEGKICPVYPNLPVEDIHHMRGHGEGFYDSFAKDNGITLTMDKRWWLAVSRKGHIKIELNPNWAHQMGYSLPRL